LQYSVDSGCDINVVTSPLGRTALHRAILSGVPAAVELLQEFDIDISIRIKPSSGYESIYEGFTGIEFAVTFRDWTTEAGFPGEYDRIVEVLSYRDYAKNMELWDTKSWLDDDQKIA